MNKIKNNSDADLDDVLWRFMSLDKFIDLLSTKELFFASIDSFKHSDPLEGFLPKAFYNIRKNEILALNDEAYNVGINKRNSYCDKLKEVKNNKQQTEFYNELIKTTDIVASRYKQRINKLLKTNLEISTKSKLINCWHSNPHESEAMWKLYSDGGKGIAIKTTVKKLLGSIKSNKEISFSDVLYMDFNTTKLPDYVHTTNQPAKRMSFSHENEKRLHINSFNENDHLDLFHLFIMHEELPTSEDIQKFAEKFYKNCKIEVDLLTLIDEIYISPYSQDPFDSSVKAVCDIYSQNSELADLPTPKKSNLLEGFDWGNYLSE